MAEPDDDQALRAKLDALRGALDRRSAEKRARRGARPLRIRARRDGLGDFAGLRAASEFVAADRRRRR